MRRRRLLTHSFQSGTVQGSRLHLEVKRLRLLGRGVGQHPSMFVTAVPLATGVHTQLLCRTDYRPSMLRPAHYFGAIGPSQVEPGSASEDALLRRHAVPPHAFHLLGLLRSGMRLVVDLHHLARGELRIALRGGQPFVSKQLLDRAQVRAFLQQMRPKRVPQCVRMHLGR